MNASELRRAATAAEEMSLETDVAILRVDRSMASAPAFILKAGELFRRLVNHGAALGWVDPPTDNEISALLSEVAAASEQGDACLIAAVAGQQLAGLGYWRRYSRATHRPHADIEKLAVDPQFQGRGIGRALMQALLTLAREAGDIEVLTLDFRGDNQRAADLYRSLGFAEYGRLDRFVAVGSARYDKVLHALDLRKEAAPVERPPSRTGHPES